MFMLLQQAVPEARPALMSLIYVGGTALVVLLLLLSLVRSRMKRSALAAVASRDLPEEVRQRLGATTTNRGLRIIRWVFVVLAVFVFSFHVYWARYAVNGHTLFQELSYKDQRNRRMADSSLRGWILDRSGRLDRAFALYRRQTDGRITREYTLDQAMAHLLGSEFGDARLERALFGAQSSAVPEALDVLRNRNITQPENLDVRLTIDRDLQQAAVEQLRGRKGAVVVINPQTGEVLALYSNPSYSLNEVRSQEAWERLAADEQNKPLVNRALNEFFIPGSTFKTVTMIAAFNAGMQDQQFTCYAGYSPPGSNREIHDSGAGAHGPLGIERAYEVSCNRYFAQLAIAVGPERMRDAARLLGMGVYETPEEALRIRRQPEIWNASSPAIARAIAPDEARIVASPRMTAFDLAQVGFGQGYAGQMTPFQMALAAAAIGNVEGRLMQPRIEFNQPSAVLNQATSPANAAAMRRIMSLVTNSPSGTAYGAFGPVRAAGITSGGKTGTAQRPVTRRVTRVERDPRGNVIREYEALVRTGEMLNDSWFISIAPLENTQLAIAVVVEEGGYGGRTAAPIAAALILKARELGLLGQPPTPPSAPPQMANRAGRRPAAGSAQR